MAFAPEPFRTACLEVIYWATLEAPGLAWGKKDPDRIAALMDAVHNIPHLLKNWERCDQKLLRDFLLDYDNKWCNDDGIRLTSVYDENLLGTPPGDQPVVRE